MVYERGEGGCTVSDTVRVRDLWLFPVGWETSSTLLFAVWTSLAHPPGARPPAYHYSTPVTADSRPGPATGYHATTPPHQDLGGGTGVGGGPLCTELLPRHLRTIHGDGAWRGSRYLKLRRCFINAGLPTLVRTRPLLVPFPFRLRLAAKSPRAATQHITCPSVSVCLPVCLSVFSSSRDGLAGTGCQAALRSAGSAATVLYLPPYTCCTPRKIHERAGALAFGRTVTQCKLSLSVLGSTTHCCH